MTQVLVSVPEREETKPLKEALARFGYAPYSQVTLGGKPVQACYRFTSLGHVERQLSAHLGQDISLGQYRD